MSSDVCDYEDCQSDALVELVILDDETPSHRYCLKCLHRLAERLVQVQANYSELVQAGTPTKLACHIVKARIERREV